MFIVSPVANPSPERGSDVETNQRLAGVHPDPYLDAEIGRPDVLDDAKGRPHGPLRIVLMGEWHPEHADHRVPDELLDHPTVGLDPRPTDGLVGAEQPRDVFGIQTFPKAVDPTRSQNRAVITLRSSRIGVASSLVPHSSQNLAPSRFS